MSISNEQNGQSVTLSMSGERPCQQAACKFFSSPGLSSATAVPLTDIPICLFRGSPGFDCHATPETDSFRTEPRAILSNDRAPSAAIESKSTATSDPTNSSLPNRPFVSARIIQQRSREPFESELSCGTPRKAPATSCCFMYEKDVRCIVSEEIDNWRLAGVGTSYFSLLDLGLP